MVVGRGGRATAREAEKGRCVETMRHRARDAGEAQRNMGKEREGRAHYVSPRQQGKS